VIIINKNMGPWGGVVDSDNLKGQCHEIFDPRFFRLTVPLGPLIHGQKRFCI
jgi:hypothetical protein